MSNLIRILIGAVLALAVAQVAVPRIVSGEMAAELRAVTGPASQDTVAVDAVPFWQLFSGQFQDLTWTARDVAAAGLTLNTLTLVWTDGGLDPAELVRDHRLVVTRPGRLKVTLEVDGPALAHFLAQSGRLQNAVVTVTPNGLHVTGAVHVGGLSGPLDATGQLKLSADAQQILFEPTRVDGYSVPFAATLVVFDVRTLNLPVPLRLTGVRLAPPFVVVTAASP